MNPNQTYFNGDFYQAASACAPGESPTAKPLQWRKVQLPKRFRWVLAHLTYANLLELDGQKDKANDERQIAIATDRIGLEDLARTEAQKDVWLGRASVETRGGAM